jgi:WhiB family redox-sensing transcriptional regulator
MKMPWNFEGASCWGIDTEMFFAEDKPMTLENYQAKKICKSCIVVEDCLTYALHYKVIGIWGGTTMNERDRLRKKLNIIAKPITNERHIA